jgi:hypothetical protein
MTGGIEGVAEGLADVATGGALARSVEPAAAGGDAGRGADGGHTHEGACLNCGTILAGPHCHACGQRAHVHRTLGAFFHDLLHGVLHFEGKTWRTIPMLAWRPGQLTREYIDGRRARYVSPIALFLFVVFLSFAVFNLFGEPLANGGVGPEGQGIVQINTAYNTGEAELAELRLARKSQIGDAKELAETDRKIAEIEERQTALKSIAGSVGTEFGKGFEDNPLPKGSALAKAVDHVRENPQLAIYKAQSSAYKYSWMLIPLSVPFVWLLFPFSRRFAGYDHTVFATYSITFMIALVALVSLLFYAGAGDVGGLLMFYAPYHMYRQLRGTYALTRFGALWRMLALSAFAWLAIALFAAIIAWMAGS